MRNRSNAFSSLFLSLVLLTICLPVSRGQSAPQQQLPPPQDTQSDVLRINTDIVQTDLMVLDKQGRAVKGLAREQFELLVDGQPQPVLFFESVEAGGGKEAAKLAAARGKTAAEVAAAAAAASASTTSGRTFIFFIDDLHLSQSSIHRTREMLGKFIDKMEPNDQAMLFTPTNQLGFLQQLTDNKTVLRLAVSRINYQSQFAPPSGRRAMTVAEALAIDRGQRDVLDYKIKQTIDDMGLERKPTDAEAGSSSAGGSGTAQTSSGSTLINLGGGMVGEIKGDRPSVGVDGGGGTGMGMRRQQAESIVKGQARHILTQANSIGMQLLSSLETVARGSASLPGRKLVFFISDGFVIDTRNSTTGERLQRVIDTAARSGVAVYTFDSQGLTADFADASQDVFSDIAGRSGSQNSSTSATSLALDESRELKAVLRALAEDTGGRAILNRNDLESGLQQVIGETASYYVLAWKPLEVEAGKPKFKTIQVKVKGRSDLRVLSRKGYFSAPPPPLPSDEKPAGGGTTTAAAGKASDAEIRSAIIAPFPKRQLNVAAYAVLTNEASSGYKITALTDLSGYALAQEKGELDYAAVILDDKGKSISGVGQKVNAPSDEDGAKPFRVTAKLPNTLPPGLYQVRVAARDARTGRIGSVFQWVEVPEFKPGKMFLSSLVMAEAVEDSGKGATIEVARRFARTSSMILQFFVYNPALSGTGQPDVTVSLNVLQNGKGLIGAKPTPLPAGADKARLEYSSGFPLGNIPPGKYALQVTVEDRIGKTTATQQLDFVVE